MLSKWNGEFEWDNFTVKLHTHRGQETGVVIEYGKNLTELEQDEDNSGVYTQLLPYAVYTAEGAETETVVTLEEEVLPIISTEMARSKTLIKDFTDRFDMGLPITEEQLRAVANDYIQSNPLGETLPTVKVSFEPLWKQPEYSALLERVRLCDTVTIRHTALGVSVSAVVIQTVYDCLAERYVSITLGSAKSSMITTISEVQHSVQKVAASFDRFPKLLSTAIRNATSLITGQSGGYVVLNGDEDEHPYELLILDAPDLSDAVNVWRWNVNGLGFSDNGYNGPYTTAITADGQIVADFITSGSLVANIIKAGVIQSQDGTSWWDLESGEVHLSSYATTAAVDAVIDRVTTVEERMAELKSISTGDDPPENPEMGQLWVNTSVTPPQTMVFNGEDWIPENDLETLRTTVSTNTTRIGEIQTSAEGLSSFVSSLTETLETLSDEQGTVEERVLSAEQQLSELSQTVSGMSLVMSEQYLGGMNYVQNSAGLNGLTDDWSYSGTVRVDSSTDTQNNTISDSCFVLGESSTLSQYIRSVLPGTYTITIRAKKSSATMSAYVYVQYNGNRTKYLFSRTTAFDWTEFTTTITDVTDPTLRIYCYNRDEELCASDIMLTEGALPRKWTPAPNEIYTSEVKIDRRGIEVSNNASSQRTVITNTEFAGYYNDEVIFTLNKDETQTKKTTVDGELIVGKTKFVPMPTASQGLNIVILD